MATKRKPWTKSFIPGLVSREQQPSFDLDWYTVVMWLWRWGPAAKYTARTVILSNLDQTARQFCTCE